RRRRRRGIQHLDGRRGRTPPRVHPEQRAEGGESGCVRERLYSCESQGSALIHVFNSPPRHGEHREGNLCTLCVSVVIFFAQAVQNTAALENMTRMNRSACGTHG